MKCLNQAGDTIVEVLIALTIVASMLGGAYATTNRSLNNNRQAQERGEALKLAEGQLERLKSQVAAGDEAVFTHTGAFCLDQNNTVQTAIVPPSTPNPACTIPSGGPIYALSIERTDPAHFELSINWDRAGGNGQDMISMVYQVHSMGDAAFLDDPVYVPPPPPPPVDLCSNVPGLQETVPAGATRTNGECFVNLTYSYTGSVQQMTVPAGVTSMTVELWGAEGAHDPCYYYPPNNGIGGRGGYIRSVISVTPGQVLYFNVGGMGSVASGSAFSLTQGNGGYNGGGNGGYVFRGQAPWFSGGGGGASDIRASANSVGNRRVVAGGGGASGGCYRSNGQVTSYTQNGGHGGGLVGQNGAHVFTSPANAAQGGSQVSGGRGSTLGNAGGSGSLGAGGAGGQMWFSAWGNDGAAGGGGGGGYYGGGGGAGWQYSSGGAGGSSYSSGTIQANQQGIRYGNGEIRLVYVPQ